MDRYETVVFQKVEELVEKPVRSKAQKPQDVVQVIEHESARAPRKTVVVSDNITGFSPELEHPPESTLREANASKDIIELESTMLVEVDSSDFDVARDFAVHGGCSGQRSEVAEGDASALLAA